MRDGAAWKADTQIKLSLFQVGRPVWMSGAGDIMGDGPRDNRRRSVRARVFGQYGMSLSGETPVTLKSVRYGETAQRSSRSSARPPSTHIFYRYI